MMYFCSNCGAYLKEKELMDVVYDGGRKHCGVCPECFADVRSSLDVCSPEEEEAELAARRADEEFDRLRDEGKEDA